MALDMWYSHLQLLTALEELRVLEYPGSVPQFCAFLTPLLSNVAVHLTQLTKLSFSVANVESFRQWRWYQASAALPPHVVRMQHLQCVELTGCKMAVRDPACWHALAALQQLTRLTGIDASCAAPVELQLPELRVLGIDVWRGWVDAGQINTAPAAGAGGGAWQLSTTFPKLVDMAIGFKGAELWCSMQPVLAELTALTQLCVEFDFRLDEPSSAAFEQLGRQLPALHGLSVVYNGGPGGWRLPRMHTYRQLQRFTLQLTAAGLGAAFDEHGSLDVTDAVLLAHLLPLRCLSQLVLCRLPGITPGVVLGLCSASPLLEQLQFVHCQQINQAEDSRASWEGSDLQLARAALEDAAAAGDRIKCEVAVYAHESVALRSRLGLPCEVSYVRAHLQQF
ncbi:hypothetical protein COO60DRAFT_1566478 [Scenedesmus sp. NREL 46B-D3]|nr:hypothetical protein COO60DRAFT_1566478 [Scenedesmus sp. NREL 46B-D3]